MWSLKIIQMNVYAKRNRLTDTENSVVVTKGGEGRAEGQDGGMGLTDTNYYV